MLQSSKGVDCRKRHVRITIILLEISSGAHLAHHGPWYTFSVLCLFLLATLWRKPLYLTTNQSNIARATLYQSIALTFLIIVAFVLNLGS
jgi:hypothetical protein